MEGSRRGPCNQTPYLLRLVAVFDRSQVDPLPEFRAERSISILRCGRSRERPGAPVQPLAAFGESLGTPSASKPFPAPLADSATAGRSASPWLSAGDFSHNAQVAVEIHEFTHALLGCDRREQDPQLSYGEKEVVVECVVYAVCSTVGLDTAGSPVPYIASWRKGGEIERYADLIDRLATRLEDAALAGGDSVVDEEPIAS